MKMRPYRIRGIQILARRGNSVKQIAQEIVCSEEAVLNYWPADTDKPKAKKPKTAKDDPDPEPEKANEDVE